MFDTDTHARLVMTYSGMMTSIPTSLQKDKALSPRGRRGSVKLSLDFCPPSTLQVLDLCVCPCCCGPNPNALEWCISASGAHELKMHWSHLHAFFKGCFAPFDPHSFFRAFLGTLGSAPRSLRVVSSLCGYVNLCCNLVFVLMRFLVVFFFYYFVFKATSWLCQVKEAPGIR